jgi:hypothetical protein
LGVVAQPLSNVDHRIPNEGCGTVGSSSTPVLCGRLIPDVIRPIVVSKNNDLGAVANRIR